MERSGHSRSARQNVAAPGAALISAGSRWRVSTEGVTRAEWRALARNASALAALPPLLQASNPLDGGGRGGAGPATVPGRSTCAVEPVRAAEDATLLVPNPCPSPDAAACRRASLPGSLSRGSVRAGPPACPAPRPRASRRVPARSWPPASPARSCRRRASSRKARRSSCPRWCGGASGPRA